MDRKRELTVARLRSVLDYEPATGSFFWKVTQGAKAAGRRAGCTDTRGYRVIGVDGNEYKAHRLAWLYVEGHWPPGMVDHINGDPSDNRLCNLRIATPSQNQANRATSTKSGTGRKGVHFNKRTGKWEARISVGGFTSADEAERAYSRMASLAWGDFHCLGSARVARWTNEGRLP